MSINLSNRLIDTMIHSNTNQKTKHHSIVSVLFHSSSKQVGKIHLNDDRNYCRGKVCSSVHSELKTLLGYFGKDLCFSKKHGWYSRCEKTKQIEYYGDPT